MLGGRIVYRVDIASGHRDRWKELHPPYPQVIGPTDVEVTPDGRTYFTYYQKFQTDLYLVDGIR